MLQYIQILKWGGARSIVIKLLGIFLLVTAALKMHGLYADPYGQDNFLALPWLQILTIEIEVILGLWLLSGLVSSVAWWITLVFFTILAVISFTLASQGQASCGCFGKVEVNPWYTFALDVGIVVTMLVLSLVSTPFASRVASAPGGTEHLRSLFQVALLTAVLLGIIALGFTIITGDPWAALARLRGESLAVLPAVTQLGEGVIGESRTFQVQLRNYGDKPIRIEGGTTTCSCRVTDDLPVQVPPGETKALTVFIIITGEPGRFSKRFILYTDAEDVTTVGKYAGTVLQKPVKIVSEARADSSKIDENEKKQR